MLRIIHALHVALLVGCWCSACNPAELDECVTSAGATSFLQVSGTRSRKVIYSPSLFLGLDRIANPGDHWREFEVVRDTDGACFMAIPNVTKRDASGHWLEVEDQLARSDFVFGECPRVIPTARSTYVNLRLDPEVDGTNSSGWNPSMVHLPEKLKQAFPEGRWLAVLRVGGHNCPAGTEAVGHMLRSVIAPLFMSEYAELGLKPEVVDQASDWKVMSLPTVFRTWVAVLDADMRTLARSEVRMLHGDSVLDDMAIADARIFLMQNGEILMGFMPYVWDGTSYYAMANDKWYHHEVVGKLEVGTELPPGLKPWQASSAPQIFAWVDRSAARKVEECPELGLHAPGPKKNLGFFEDAAGMHALDWINPVKVGLINVEELRSTPRNLSANAAHVEKICYGYEDSPPEPSNNPLDDILIQDYQGFLRHAAHNSPPLLSVPEAHIFLGVGHFRRGCYQHADPSTEGFVDYGGITCHHYTHFFFALNATAPHPLVSVTSEFCLESAQKAGDCETTQFVSSLNREQDKLVVGYGVQDCEAYVLKLDLAEILRWLKPV